MENPPTPLPPTHTILERINAIKTALKKTHSEVFPVQLLPKPLLSLLFLFLYILRRVASPPLRKSNDISISERPTLKSIMLKFYTLFQAWQLFSLKKIKE